MRPVRMLERGVVVIPAKIRSLLGWDAGDLFVPEVDGDRLILTRLVPGTTQGGSAEGPSTKGIGGGGASAFVPSGADLEELTHEERLVLRELGAVPLHLDRITYRSGVPVKKVMVALIHLELKGLARHTPIGYVTAGG